MNIPFFRNNFKNGITDGIQFQNLANNLGAWLLSLDLNSKYQFNFKEDNSIVTTLDFEISNQIKRLAKSTFPEIQIVSEEDGFFNNGISNRLILLVDPLDGTENFASGLPIWGVGLAMFIDGLLNFSCVLFPEIRLGHVSQKIELPFGYRSLRSVSSTNGRLSLFPANLFHQDIVQKNNSNQQRILGCSLLNLSLACYGNVKFCSSGAGLRSWDFLPAILPAIENNLTVLVNNKKYHGEYLSPKERYTIEIY